MSKIKKIAMIAAKKAAIETYRSIMKLADGLFEAKPILDVNKQPTGHVDEDELLSFLRNNGAKNVAETVRGADMGTDGEKVLKDPATLKREWAGVKGKIGPKTTAIIIQRVYDNTGNEVDPATGKNYPKVDLKQP
jgi:hypothetical protein